MAGQFSERQREIVTATFNVGRDWRQIAPELVEEDIATIALSQGSLMEEVRSFLAELEGRLQRAPEEMRQVAEELPLATAQMEAALAELGENDTEEALPPEQRALQHLLRAESVFREIQLAQQQNQGGGGGGASGAEIREDLADFFDLEMDRLRNQYEELQRGQRQQMDQELNSALERLKELARRQEQEQERLQRVAERLPPGAAGAGGESQRRLAEEAEELARELERLSREHSSPELAQTARELRGGRQRDAPLRHLPEPEWGGTGECRAGGARGCAAAPRTRPDEPARTGRPERRPRLRSARSSSSARSKRRWARCRPGSPAGPRRSPPCSTGRTS